MRGPVRICRRLLGACWQQHWQQQRTARRDCSHPGTWLLLTALHTRWVCLLLFVLLLAGKGGREAFFFWGGAFAIQAEGWGVEVCVVCFLGRRRGGVLPGVRCCCWFCAVASKYPHPPSSSRCILLTKNSQPFLSRHSCCVSHCCCWLVAATGDSRQQAAGAAVEILSGTGQ